MAEKKFPVYDTRTGAKQPNSLPLRIIEHPVLGRHLSLTPSVKAPDKRTRKPRAPKTPDEPAVENIKPATGGETERTDD